jgi:nitrite reductase (NADH) small subunit
LRTQTALFAGKTALGAAIGGRYLDNDRMKTSRGYFDDMTSATLVINLGPIERIPLGEGREFAVEGELIAVFRTRAGQLHATQAKCPHRDGPLADGIIGGGRVICPLHAFKFGLETGQPIGNVCESLKTYQISLSETDEILLNI